jgi:hypothetical protein
MSQMSDKVTALCHVCAGNLTFHWSRSTRYMVCATVPPSQCLNKTNVTFVFLYSRTLTFLFLSFLAGILDSDVSKAKCTHGSCDAVSQSKTFIARTGRQTQMEVR